MKSCELTIFIVFSVHTAQYKYINSKENGNPLRLRENESQAKVISPRKTSKLSNKAQLTEDGRDFFGREYNCACVIVYPTF